MWRGARSYTISFSNSAARGCGAWFSALGYLSERVVKAVGDGSKFDLEVVYSFDGPDLRGTAGAVKQALPLLGPAFFVLYGDSFLRCSYAAVQHAFETAGKLAMMTDLPQRRSLGYQ